MAKLDVTGKSVIIYLIIMIIVSIFYFIGAYLLVDKFTLTTGLMYSLIAYPIAGALKYILLTMFWKRKR